MGGREPIKHLRQCAIEFLAWQSSKCLLFSKQNDVGNPPQSYGHITNLMLSEIVSVDLFLITSVFPSRVFKREGEKLQSRLKKDDETSEPDTEKMERWIGPSLHLTVGKYRHEVKTIDNFGLRLNMC